MRKRGREASRNRNIKGEEGKKTKRIREEEGSRGRGRKGEKERFQGQCRDTDWRN